MDEHFYTIARELDSLRINSVNRQSLNRVLTLIKSDKDAKSYFFSKLERPDWFKPLKVAGYFSFEENPGHKEDPENKGYFSFPEWPALPYLEKVAEYVTQSNDSRTAVELIEIIQTVSSPRANISPTDNPRTWWYFVKILVKLPNGFIPKEVLKLIPTWLTSKFKMSLADSEICERLLPKFLQSPPEHVNDYEKAESIFDGVTSLTESQNSNEDSVPSSDGRNNLKLLADEYWLGDTLVRRELGKKIGKLCSEKLIFLSADRLLRTIEHDRFKGKHLVLDKIVETGHWWISILPTISCHFSVSIFDQDPEEEELNPVKTAESEFPLTTPEMLVDFFDENIFNEKEYYELSDKIDLNQIYFWFFNENSHIWINSFDNRLHNLERNSDHVLTLILLELLTGRAEIGENGHVPITNNILKNFIFGKYRPSIFTRIALYIINQKWSDFNSLFEKILNEPYCRYYFDDLEFEAEMYLILESQSKSGQLSESSLDRIREIIEAGPVLGRSNEAAKEYWKQKWFSAVKTLDRFSGRYSELKEKTKIKEELEFRGTHFRVGPGASPLTIQEIISMPNNELVNYFEEFRNTDTWRKPTVNALADVFGLSVKENPEKFVANLSPFKNASFLFAYKLIVGLREAWKSKKTFSWENVFRFLLEYIQEERFWNDALMTTDDEWHTTHTVIVGEIGWLLQDATIDDDWAIPESYNSDAEDVIRLVLEKFESDTNPSALRRDPVNDTLNSTYGKILTALIYLSLRDARLRYGSDSSKSKMRWKESLKELYQGSLNKKIPESYVLSGQYMSQFTFLDKDWIDTNISEFEQLSNEYWYLFMYGYLFGSHTYANLYPEMLPHYFRALKQDDVEKNWLELFLDHIALGYMSNISGFGLDRKGLLGKIMQKWEPAKLERIVEVFWRHPRYDSKTEDANKSLPAEKFFKIWNKVYEKFKVPAAVGGLSEEEKALLSELLKLTMWLPELNEKYTNWLIQAAPYVNNRHNSMEFVEYLSYLTKRGKTSPADSARYLARIYSEMLKGYVPEYKQEHIQVIISYLYENGDSRTKETADSIVEIYARKGLHFLQDIWEENNKES